MVAALHPQADELIAEVMAELRFNLRKTDAPSPSTGSGQASGASCGPTARAFATGGRAGVLGRRAWWGEGRRHGRREP